MNVCGLQINVLSAPRQIWLARVLLLVLWTCFWFLPWQGLLASAAWLRVLFSYAAFLIPGILIAAILLPRGIDPSDALTLGLVISIAVTGLLGLAAKLLQFSISFVGDGLYVCGAAALLLTQPTVSIPKNWRQPRVWKWTAIIPLALGLVVVARLTLGNVLGGDDGVYNAYLTHFVDAPRIDFGDIFFQLNRPAPVRYAIDMWMMSEAVLSKWSNLHALQFTFLYIAPLMAVTSVIAMYKLARALNLSSQAAAWASALQVVCLLWLLEPSLAGATFFNRLSNDKVAAAFVVAPIFLRAALGWLNAPQWRTFLLASFCAAGLVLTHPTIFGFTCGILGLYGVFEWVLNRKPLRPLVALGGMLVLLMIVPALFRLFPGSWTMLYAFTPDEELAGGTAAARLTQWNGFLYGLDPQLVLDVPFGIALAACAAALTRLRSSPVARYILAAGIFVMLAVLPLTAWLLGIVFTPFQLWRIPWLMPFGICAVLLGSALRDWFAPRLPRMLFTPGLAALGVVVLVVATAAWVNFSQSNRLDALKLKPGWTQRYDPLVEIGHALDAELQGTNVVLGTDIKTNDALPGLSAKARIIAYHRVSGTLTMGLMDEAEAQQRWQAWQALTAPQTTSAERRRLLAAYQVHYILARGNVPWLQTLSTTASGLVPLKRAGAYTLYELASSD